MSDKVKTMGQLFRTFADLPKDAIVTAEVRPETRHWVNWDPTAKRVDVLAESTRTLATWLDARFADLVREKVPLESVFVKMDGAWTIISVDGRVRFSFKLKCQMEGK